MYNDIYYDRQMESFAFAERWRCPEPPDPPPVPDDDEDAGDKDAGPCRHRFVITDPACRVCSGIPRRGCPRYAPEDLPCD